MGDIEIDGTETLTLIDTGATVNVMDMSTLHTLKTRLVVRPTSAQIYPYGGKMLLTQRGIMAATVKNDAEKIKMTFKVKEGNTRTRLGCSASKSLILVSFAWLVKRAQGDNAGEEQRAVPKCKESSQPVMG